MTGSTTEVLAEPSSVVSGAVLSHSERVSQPDERGVRVHEGLVHRPAQEWTPSVPRLLHHLHRRLPGVVPQPIALDGDEEVLTFLAGDAGAQCWAAQADEHGLASAARLLRTVHDASRGYVPEPGASWGMAPLSPQEVLCHGDPGPWNMVWREGLALGVFDWDFAHPGPALDDVAYALEYFTPFRSDEQALRWHGSTSPPKRRRRLELFVRAYGWAEPLDVPALIESVIARQRATINTVAALAARGVQPQQQWVHQGYLDELAERVRWSEEHRHLLKP